MGVSAADVLVHRGPLLTPTDRNVTRDPEKNGFMFELNGTVRGVTVPLGWRCEALQSMLWHGGPQQPLQLVTRAGRRCATYEQVVRPFRFDLELPA